MSQRSAGLLKTLMELGRSGERCVPATLVDRDRAWRSIMCGDEPWQRVALELREQELRWLIRGMVFFFAASDFWAGSVPPVIPLFTWYALRFPAEEPSLTAWIVANRIDEYEPFGTRFTVGAGPLRSFAHFNDAIMAERNGMRISNSCGSARRPPNSESAKRGRRHVT